MQQASGLAEAEAGDFLPVLRVCLHKFRCLEKKKEGEKKKTKNELRIWAFGLHGRICSSLCFRCASEGGILVKVGDYVNISRTEGCLKKVFSFSFAFVFFHLLSFSM